MLGISPDTVYDFPIQFPGHIAPFERSCLLANGRGDDACREWRVVNGDEEAFESCDRFFWERYRLARFLRGLCRDRCRAKHHLAVFFRSCRRHDAASRTWSLECGRDFGYFILGLALVGDCRKYVSHGDGKIDDLLADARATLQLGPLICRCLCIPRFD